MQHCAVTAVRCGTLSESLALADLRDPPPPNPNPPPKKKQTIICRAGAASFGPQGAKTMDLDWTLHFEERHGITSLH